MTVSCELPEDAKLKQSWDTFVTKIKKKAEIEAGKEKISQMKKQHEEEISVYQSNEDICKWIQQYYDINLLNFMQFQ